MRGWDSGGNRRHGKGCRWHFCDASFAQQCTTLVHLMYAHTNLPHISPHTFHTLPPHFQALSHRLVKIDRPIMRIPMLAIHLQRDIHSAGFKPNLQTNFAPVLATAAKAQLDKSAAVAAAAVAAAKGSAASSSGAAAPGAGAGAGLNSNSTPTVAKHHQLLLDMVAKQLGVTAEDIVDFELHLCDIQPGRCGEMYGWVCW